ncbi:hypothetical protein EVAR_97135_1 [Eumeta japonica]|uniref:Uncharacterized protein n=1 Tax=Eumeta variegata TaxID=151549 RepID=A0A4C1WPC1_EUMVA|nr:hypothetical protein EVAR_97135_1 [Eumeta japonica]
MQAQRGSWAVDTRCHQRDDNIRELTYYPRYENEKWVGWLLAYHTLTDNGREVAVSVVEFRPLSESDQLPPLFSIIPILDSIRYPIPFREASNALATPPGLRVTMGSGDRLLSDGSPDRLPLEPTHVKDILRKSSIQISYSAMVIKINDSVKKRDTKVYVSKTKGMVFERGESTTEFNIYIEDERVEHMKVFLYLGGLFTTDDKNERDIERRVNAGNKMPIVLTRAKVSHDKRVLHFIIRY